MTQGGSSVPGLMKEEECPWDDRFQVKGYTDVLEEKVSRHREGWFGWTGFGGSAI